MLDYMSPRFLEAFAKCNDVWPSEFSSEGLEGLFFGGSEFRSLTRRYPIQYSLSFSFIVNILSPEEFKDNTTFKKQLISHYSGT